MGSKHPPALPLLGDWSPEKPESLLPRLGTVGLDEVGRGCLCGPVVAAVVMLSPTQGRRLAAAGLTDSKKLTARQRERLAQQIQAQSIQCYWGIASVAEIDRLNILQASLLAMRRAVLKCKPLPEQCWIDGNQMIPGLAIPQTPIVEGDRRCLTIAAASVVAKVWRDHLMERLHQRYPGYDLDQNKGYGTQRHRSALEQIGPCPQHRRSFRGVLAP